MTDSDTRVSDDSLRDEVQALLANKAEFDERKAKHLCKQWDARRADADAKPRSVATKAAAGDASAVASETKSESADAAADSDLPQLINTLRARMQSESESRQKHFVEAEEKLQALRDCLERGDTRQAQALEQGVVNALNRIGKAAGARRQAILTGLDEVRPKLQDLASWRNWGTDLAREKIIEEIKTIHDSGRSLPQIAQRIQDARKEWQDWDASGARGSKKLYHKFNRVCAQAYKPCQAYFEERKEKQKSSVQTRERICEVLEKEFETIDWRRQPQWQKIAQLLHVHKKKWHASGPPDFKQRRQLKRRFDAIVAKYEERLERERARNVKIREKLIDEVTQLAKREDVNAAIAELQELKSDWVPTVQSSRAKERALWNRFTAACDLVYANRKRERKAAEKTLKQNFKAREELCIEIEKSCNAKDADGTAVAGRLASWQARWGKLGDVPKAREKAIEERFRKALKTARKVAAAAEADAASRVRKVLREKAEVCVALEAMALDDAPGDAAELREKWGGLEALPEALEAMIGKRYELALRAADDEKARAQLRDSLAANLQAVHALLLQLEIQAELPSPPEFSRQRMALQVQRLSAAMGKAAAASESTDELVQRILLVGPLEGAAREGVVARLEKCLAACS